MRKFLIAVVVVMGMLALSFPASAQVVPTPTITGGAQINCSEWPASLDWNLVVGPDYLIGDNATIVLDGVRVQDVDLIFTDSASGTFFPVDSTVSHTVVFTWYDSLNLVLATDTVTISTPATCKVPRPTAVLSCSGLVLGNVDGSEPADFEISINGLPQTITVGAHQSLTINTIHDGDFIIVKTPSWNQNWLTLIQSTLHCTVTTPSPSPVPPTGGVKTFSYRVAVHMPKYRSGTFSMTFPAATSESSITVTVVRTCSRFTVNFLDANGTLIDSVSARSIPGRSTLTVKGNANAGAGWYLKKAAVAKLLGC